MCHENGEVGTHYVQLGGSYSIGRLRGEEVSALFEQDPNMAGIPP